MTTSEKKEDIPPSAPVQDETAAAAEGVVDNKTAPATTTDQEGVVDPTAVSARAEAQEAAALDVEAAEAIEDNATATATAAQTIDASITDETKVPAKAVDDEEKTEAATDTTTTAVTPATAVAPPAPSVAVTAATTTDDAPTPAPVVPMATTTQEAAAVVVQLPILPDVIAPVTVAVAEDTVTAEQVAAETEAAVAAAVAASNMDTSVGAATEPTDRDIILGVGGSNHKTNLLLQDIIRLHRILWKLHDKPLPSAAEEVSAMADHIIGILKNGKSFEIAGLKDVPKPFMKSKGRFLESDSATNTWTVLDSVKIKTCLTEMILHDFALDDLGSLDEPPYRDLKDWITKKANRAAAEFLPEARDAILLRCTDYAGEKMYEQQGGNKTMFHLASQLVTSYTNSPDKRVEAALAIMKGLDDLEHDGSDKSQMVTTTKSARFLIRTQREDMVVAWDIMDPATAAEFTVIFVFEVFLEKEIHVANNAVDSSGLTYALAGAGVEAGFDMTKAGTVSVGEPTDYDVLFGRGGMTNSHPGNRRFRDIIALHRPDYIRAIKMDKPGVARKIVKAIRQGNPPGRFLKKHDDGLWYDVGDRTAAEKTSQGLRERSNHEKRQRSALREALRIRKQDMEEDDNPSKKAKMGDSDSALPPTLNYVGTNLPVPLSLSMKDPHTKTITVPRKKAPAAGKTLADELNCEGLPPNAVDEDGNILVTDYDILCGRGGLTNHHKGNKRFRDIVALHRPDYVRAPKIQKPSVARVIVRAIRNGDPPGRFLRKDEKTGKWVDIGDKKSAEKTSQALREKTGDDPTKRNTVPGTGVGVLLPSPASYLAAGMFPAGMLQVPVPVPAVAVAPVEEVLAPAPQPVQAEPAPAPEEGKPPEVDIIRATDHLAHV